MNKVKKEFLKMFPPTIFFFIALHLVVLIRILMLAGTGLTTASFLEITVAALILGKSVLIADMMPFINRFPTKPLIYNVTWKTGIYLFLATLLHYLERMVGFWRENGNLIGANREFLEKTVWPHFWAIELLLLMLIAMYCTVRELVRIIGPQKTLRMFFGPLPEPDASSQPSPSSLT